MTVYKYPKEFILKLIQLYLTGNYSFEKLAQQFNIHKSTLKEWFRKYEAFGEGVFAPQFPQRRYTKEQKVKAVEDYLSGEYSLLELMQNHQISGRTILMKWVKKYTSHSEIKDSGKGMSQAMTKGRKTTVEERMEIVDYCLKHEKNYQLTAEIHQVSYQQVYQWVKKFEAFGEDGLRDRRGRTKSESELTTAEKLKLEIKRIERENERLRAENLFLKKLEEIERKCR